MVLQAAPPAQNTFKNRHWAERPRFNESIVPMSLCWRSTIVQEDQVITTYTAYFAYFAYFETFLSQHGLMGVSQSTIVYERHEKSQVLYVIPVSSILGRLPLVPLGETETIPFASEMRKELRSILQYAEYN